MMCNFFVFFNKFDFDPDLEMDPDPDLDPELPEKLDPDPEIIFSDPTHWIQDSQNGVYKGKRFQARKSIAHHA